MWVATKGNAPLVRRLGRWASDAVHSYLWNLPVLTEGTTAAMVTADTTVPWGSVRKGVMAVAEVEVATKEEAQIRVGGQALLMLNSWCPVCTICPVCG